jgi:regulator of protease activity HflC (stomatin/prohibitin superfamily)
MDYGFFLPIPLVLFALFLLRSSFFIVHQQSVAIVEVLGKFQSVRSAGFNIKLPNPIARIAGRLTLRLQDVTASVEVKTVDNVFIAIPVSLQFRVIPERAQEAFYSLSRPVEQIQSFILNNVRTTASSMTLEHIYTAKNVIAHEVETELKERLAGFGYSVEALLIDQPLPPPDVQAAFNRVISAQRGQEAAKMEGEALRIRIVAEAEADKQSKQLQGEGIALQRRAIADGFREAVQHFKGAMPEADEALIVATLLATNQFDVIRDAANKPATLILMPYSGDAPINDIARMAAAIRGLEVSAAGKKG